MISVLFVRIAKEIQVRKVVYGARKNLPTIRADLALLEKLLETYERNKTK